MPALVSNCREWEKPEHPPPTTPTRRPAGAGFCCAMSPFTLAMAFGVRLMGAAFTSCGVGVVGVVVVFDIPYLLESTSVNCSKRRRADSDKILLHQSCCASREFGDKNRDAFAEAYKTVGLDFTLEEQARITLIAEELTKILESAKKRQQEKLRSAS